MCAVLHKNFMHKYVSANIWAIYNPVSPTTKLVASTSSRLASIWIIPLVGFGGVSVMNASPQCPHFNAINTKNGSKYMYRFTN